MNSTAAKLMVGEPSYTAWIGQLKAKFEQPEEYELACAIYSFATAFEDGMSPQQAYDSFDFWVSA